jgi:hypothetical protein
MIAPTTDRFRADIAAGRMGDKVPGSEPAAAPLGTDDEAGGCPPRAASVSTALRNETRRPATPTAGHGLGYAWVLVAVIILVAAILCGALAWRA